MREQAAGRPDDKPIGELLPPQTDVPRCFVCGQENPSGLKVRFRKEGPDTISMRFTPPRDWTGWANVMHGGFHALLLDEIMAMVPFGLWNERAFVTRDMTLRYLRPAYVEMPLLVIGTLEQDLGREVVIRGEIRDEHGSVLTEARCTIVRLSPEAMQSIASSKAS